MSEANQKHSACSARSAEGVIGASRSGLEHRTVILGLAEDR
ncbi:MAG: hypothetical protein QOG87_3866 [Actinomycetota bacterium]|jgi:hypothetical protein